MGQASRARLTTVMLLVAVFGTGVLIGYAADTEATAQPTEVSVESSPADSTSKEEPPRRRRLYDELGPNETQLGLIDSIVSVHRARTNKLDEEMRTQLSAGFREILLETRDAIKSVFTPEQAAEYQRLLDGSDARRAARENEDERD